MKRFLPTIFPILLVVSLVFFSSSCLAGGKDRSEYPLQIQGIGTYPLGSGLSVGVHLTDAVFFGVEGFSEKYTGSETKDGPQSGTIETYDWELNLRTTLIVLRLAPFYDSGVYLQIGSVNRSWHYILSFSSEIGNSGQIASGRADVKWPDSAFNYTLGGTWIFGGLSLGLGIGAISGGAPTVEITLDDPALQSALQSEIDEEEGEIDKELTQFRSIPYAYIHLGWNF